MTLSIFHNKDYVLNKDLEKMLHNAFSLISDLENINEFSLNLKLVTDDEMEQLNLKFREIKKSTNVLSFKNEDISKERTKSLGDIAINYEYVLRESKWLEKTFEDHMIHMMVHGVLHILGYDHNNSETADLMENREIFVLNQLNIDNPYK
ncbi:MAG: rRNA maturation RNase YbeY [Gammaproteobacteria bacterium]|nr:rRNA maturation RNase YbeY [Gammaproteobacteria bacterium]